jgi:hypothetical protein
MASVLHGSARTTPCLRAEFQASKESTRALAARYSLDLQNAAGLDLHHEHPRRAVERHVVVSASIGVVLDRWGAGLAGNPRNFGAGHPRPETLIVRPADLVRLRRGTA